MLAGSADEAVQPSRKPGPWSLPAIASLQYELHVRQATVSHVSSSSRQRAYEHDHAMHS